MDPDRLKRRQSLRIIISETIMVLSVVLMVVILAFLVSGYWINSDFKVERQGLLQVSSTPSGADVYIDGDSSWLQRTNTSKVLSAGEHTVTLTKDGYDSWTRNINISEGLLYRLHYPRLFLQGTTAEEILNVDNVTYRSFSPDGSRLLLINGTTAWQLIELNDQVVKTTSLDVSGLFPSNLDQTSSQIMANIISLDWDQDGSHVLISVQVGDATEWILVDTRDIDKSINLTETFKSELSQVQILDHSANNLLALIDKSLYKIDVSGRSLSSIMANDVFYYDHYEANDVILSAASTESGKTSEYYVATLRLSDNKIEKLINTDAPAQAAISKFYDDKYFIVLQDNFLSLYNYEKRDDKQDYELNFTPDTLKVGHNGEFIVVYSDNNIATLDMESKSITEWHTDSDNFDWIDSDMIYETEKNGLVVYDYDGLNRRVIARDAATGAPAAIVNDKWLYFFKDNFLMRKAIAD